MSFSVIIPTMWRANMFLKEMLDKYEKNPHIDEVLIVNNAKHGYSSLVSSQYSKVRLLGDGTNLLVNPAWNMAVKQAKNEYIIIANDDINIVGFSLLMRLLTKEMGEGKIFGFSPNCFASERLGLPLEAISFKANPHYTLTYGFGVFMALRKDDYLPIPERMKIWYGDMYLWAQMNPCHINGFDVQTPMSVTTKTMDLSWQRYDEQNYFSEARHLFQKVKA